MRVLPALVVSAIMASPVIAVGQDINREIAEFYERNARGNRPPPQLQGFSVLLLLGETQGASQAENISAPARRALADIKDFLPYKSFRVLDTAWVAGRDEGIINGMLSGLDNQTYHFYLRTFRRTPEPILDRAQFRLAKVAQPTGFPGDVVLDNTFNIATGETIVVGTSRLQGERALIVVLTAVAATQ
jgi:hypothetical protein